MDNKRKFEVLRAEALRILHNRNQELDNETFKLRDCYEITYLLFDS